MGKNLKTIPASTVEKEKGLFNTAFQQKMGSLIKTDALINLRKFFKQTHSLLLSLSFLGSLIWAAGQPRADGGIPS